MRRVLSITHETYIRDNYLLLSIKAMSLHCNINKSTVTRFMRSEGLIVPDDLRKHFKSLALTGKTTFTPADDAVVIAEYLNLPIKAIATKIGRSYTGVMGALKRLGLDLSPEVRKRNIAAGRIRTGNISFNKGKKQSEYMTSEQIARTTATRFKAGQKPHNTYKSDGVVSIRSKHNGETYKWIRISVGYWEALHRVNWEAMHGPIPEGMILRCKDSDTLNCEPDNWELITRGEHYVRNNGNSTLSDKAVARYMATQSKKLDRELQSEIIEHHPDLIILKRNELLLNRAIKNKTNGK